MGQNTNHGKMVTRTKAEQTKNVSRWRRRDSAYLRVDEGRTQVKEGGRKAEAAGWKRNVEAEDGSKGWEWEGEASRR